jgi:hypothetical protein
MTQKSRDALRLLVAAFEEHLEAVASRRSPDDAAVDDAYESLAERFERYEEALDLEYAEQLPIVLDDSADDELDIDDLDDDEPDDDEPVDDDAEGDEIDDELDPHAVEDEDDLDDDIEAFDLSS